MRIGEIRRAWWHMIIIPALGERLSQEDHRKFKVSLSYSEPKFNQNYVARSCPQKGGEVEGDSG